MEELRFNQCLILFVSLLSYSVLSSPCSECKPLETAGIIMVGRIGENREIHIFGGKDLYYPVFMVEKKGIKTSYTKLFTVTPLTEFLS